MSKVKPLEEQLQPGKAITLYQDIELQFQGQGLTDLKEFDASKLTESVEVPVSEDQKTKAKVVTKDGKRKLVVTVEGIHAGMTKNMTFYPGTTLEESVPSWTSPHRKPVIKNHNISSEPLGRIIDAKYVESTLTDKFTVQLKLEIVDEDAIEKILDGRYLTLSVGGSANKVNCSICAKDLVQEGFCGHWRGKKYEGKSAHWIINGYTGDEISFVNAPADVFSQVIAKELVSEEGGNKMGADNKQAEQTENQEDKSLTEGAGAEDDLDIDGILSEADKSKDKKKSDDKDDDKKDDDKGKKPPSSDDDKKDDDKDDDEDSKKKTKKASKNSESSELEEKLEEANAEIERLKAALDVAESDNVSLSADLTEKDTELTSLKTQLEEANTNLAAAESEAKTFKEQNVKLAKFTRRTLAERVADIRIMQGKDEATSRETLIEEWNSSTVKVLQSTIADLLKGNVQRQQAKVTSPGLATEDKNTNSIIEDENGNPVQTSEAKKKKTLADLEESMIGYMAN